MQPRQNESTGWPKYNSKARTAGIGQLGWDT
jgi:hypothetical protein